MSTYSELVESQQASLEHLRAAREEGVPDEFLEKLEQDATKAKAAMETAWLEMIYA